MWYKEKENEWNGMESKQRRRTDLKLCSGVVFFNCSNPCIAYLSRLGFHPCTLNGFNKNRAIALQIRHKLLKIAFTIPAAAVLPYETNRGCL